MKVNSGFLTISAAAVSAEIIIITIWPGTTKLMASFSINGLSLASCKSQQFLLCFCCLIR
ncbi:hypothetical protein CS542_10760 [Pedobacter sp. IW39]|nr:hypothetical protein CS542_10760 [Pedobacter sp. IW39]